MKKGEAQQNIYPDLFNHMDGKTEISLTVTHDAKISLGLNGLWLQSGLDVIYNNMLQAHRDRECINCEWVQTDFNPMLFETSCRNTTLFRMGSIEDNGFIYCPHCGKKIKEKANARRTPENF